jgi:hypothetical protein
MDMDKIVINLMGSLWAALGCEHGPLQHCATTIISEVVHAVLASHSSINFHSS